MSTDLYPLLFEPVYKDYVWGGTRIPELFGRETQEGILAESWEIADRPEGMSVVRNGALAGTTLRELVSTRPGDITGDVPNSDPFPLLVKIIDARERLSLQVHPGEASARFTGGDPKTEMWYVLDSEPGARVLAGLRPGATMQAFEQAVQSGGAEDVLNPVEVRPGQAVFVPGGLLHAIDAGCLLLEIQQNSNTTYRVHDWGRVGHDGRPRELHWEEAMQVINWSGQVPDPIVPHPEPLPSGNRRAVVVDCPQFRVERWDLDADEQLPRETGVCDILFVLDGALQIRTASTDVRVGRGTSCLVPTAVSDCLLAPHDGPASLIRTTPGHGSQTI